MPALKKNDQIRKMTFDEFIEWAEDREGKWELHEGIPVRKHDPAKGQSEQAMHLNAKLGVAMALAEALKQSPADCHVMPDGATVRIDDHVSYEPDALVYCGKKLEGDEIIVPEPVIIVEVLSPSTAWRDMSVKLDDYFRLPSLRHYLIIAPKYKRVQHYYRQEEGKVKIDPDTDEMIRLDPPGLEIETARLFG